MVKPVVAYSYQQSVLKEEDVLLVNPELSYSADRSNDASSSLRNTRLNGFSHSEPDWADHSGGSDPSDRPGPCGVFVVCDGHNGVTAARYIADQLPSYLDDLLPPGPPPEETNAKMHTLWRHGVQRALTVSLSLMHRAFAGLGVLAGCTVTIVLQHDWLLTTACLGDSRAILDTGRQVTALTEDHRVATHQQERKRLEKKGAVIAPVNMNGGGPATKKGSVGAGPLRLWPGGLCLSRAIGDFDVGDSVLCLPYISQVLVPESGGRLVIASDGVWDAFDRASRVTSIHRQQPTQVAPQRVVNAILMTHEGLRDDTSLIVVDIMPPDKLFKECTGPRFGAMNGCMCMSSSKVVEEEPPQVMILERADIASYAGLMADKPSSVPLWFSRQLKQDLLEAGEQAMEIWSKASGMRLTGKVPSIVDFERRMEVPPAQQGLMASVEEPGNADLSTSMEDLSVRMGTAAHSLIDPEVLKRKPGQLFPEGGSQHGSDANPSVRFANAIATDSEDFGAKFGHYKKEQRQGDNIESDLAMGRGGIGITGRSAAHHGDSGASYRTGVSDNPHMMSPSAAYSGRAHVDNDVSVRAGAVGLGATGGAIGGTHPAALSGVTEDRPKKRTSSTFVPAHEVKTLMGSSKEDVTIERRSCSGGSGSHRPPPHDTAAHKSSLLARGRRSMGFSSDDDTSESKGSWARMSGSHAADIAPPPEFRFHRNSVGTLVIPAEHVKTVSGASSPAVSPMQHEASSGSSGSAGQGTKWPSVETPYSSGTSHPPMTALQKASKVEHGSQGRVRGGTAIKSVAFS